MEHLEIMIPSLIIVIGAIVHIEVNITILKTNVKWIMKTLNEREK